MGAGTPDLRTDEMLRENSGRREHGSSSMGSALDTHRERSQGMRLWKASDQRCELKPQVRNPPRECAH